MSNGNQRGRIIAPGQVNISVQNHHGPLADAVTLNVPAADGVKVITFGGLTKLEALAGQIVGHVKDPTVAVQIAEAVLEECQRKQSPQPTS